MPGRKTQPRKVKSVERRAEAIRLRIAGRTYADIGAALGISGQSAYDHVKLGLEQTAKEMGESADVVREQELQRLDRALQLVMERIEKGDMSATDRLVKLQERRAKLLGLDRPTTFEHTGGDGRPLAVVVLPPEVDD